MPSSSSRYCPHLGCGVTVRFTNRTRIRKVLDWPSIIAAAVGQIPGEGGTTAYSSNGHGQSAYNAGPCVKPIRCSTLEHQVAQNNGTKLELVGGLVVFNPIRGPLNQDSAGAHEGAELLRRRRGLGAGTSTTSHCGI